MTDARLRYFLPAVENPSGRVKLLESRKEALEATIASRFMEARASGSVASVKQLSAELRIVKRQLGVALGQLDGGRCSVCGSDSFGTAKWVRDRTVCSRCLPKVKRAASASTDM